MIKKYSVNINRNDQSYQLLIKIAKDISLLIGKLGHFDIPAGYYVYTGSAKHNIEARLHRHHSRDKKLHWHIDYLLQHPDVQIVNTQTSHRDECKLNAAVEGYVIIQGFGASDCKQHCGSHLKRIDEQQAVKLFLDSYPLHPGK